METVLRLKIVNPMSSHLVITVPYELISHVVPLNALATLQSFACTCVFSYLVPPQVDGAYVHASEPPSCAALGAYAGQ